MKKGIAPILIILLGLVIVGGSLLSVKYLQKGASPTYEVQQGATGQSTQQQNQSTSSVPLPTEEDTIRNFFQLINEKRVPEAIETMSKEMAADDSTKQAWGVHFNAIKSISVQKIEPSMKESWTDNRHTYKVTLEAYVSSEAADAPIPYYGWGDNPNYRWVSIVKEGNLWKIAEIATGP